MDRIRSLPPSKRKHYRIQAPIRVEIQGRSFETIDWSVGGFRIKDYPGEAPESPFEVTLSIPFQGYWVNARARVQVVRHDAEQKQLAAQFLDLEERTRNLLDYFARGLLSGELSSVEGAIQRIDTPVTPTTVEVERDPRELSWSFHVRRWSRYLAYLAVGFVLTWYVGSTLYSRVWRLEVSTATVAAPTESILSPTGGWIEELYVAEGDQVRKGEALFRMIDQEASAKERTAKRRMADAEIAFRRARDLEEVEEKKIEIYRSVLQARMAASDSRLALLRANAELLDRNRERTAALVESGAVSIHQLEVSESDYAALQAEIESVKSQAAVDKANLDALAEGFLIESGRFQANLPQIQAELELARAKYELEKQSLAAQQEEDSIVVRAPFAGTVVSIAKAVGTSIQEGTELLRLEQAGVRRIEAWLSPEEAEFVRLHGNAEVEIKSLGYRFRGVVLEIDSSSTTARDSSLLGNAPGLRVVVGLIGLSEEDLQRGVSFQDAMAELSASDSLGLLAKVCFHRDW